MSTWQTALVPLNVRVFIEALNITLASITNVTIFIDEHENREMTSF